METRYQNVPVLWKKVHLSLVIGCFLVLAISNSKLTVFYDHPVVLINFWCQIKTWPTTAYTELGTAQPQLVLSLVSKLFVCRFVLFNFLNLFEDVFDIILVQCGYGLHCSVSIALTASATLFDAFSLIIVQDDSMTSCCLLKLSFRGSFYSFHFH